MKMTIITAVLAVMFVAPNSCFALWEILPVSKATAKELGMEVRSRAVGQNRSTVEFEFKTEGELKNFSRVELLIGVGNNPPVTAPLREDRSKPGRVVVSFTADRAQLDKLKLWVYVPDSDGGTIYDLRVSDFIEMKKDR
jgi:hypothetical protein